MAREQERAELHRTIWNAANELVHGGKLTPVQFMNYMLGGLFYRFISENLTNFINSEERKTDPTFDYASLSDEAAEQGRSEIIIEKGFYILPSQLFENVAKRAEVDSTDLNEILSETFSSIENSAQGTPSEDDIKGLFTGFDVNSIYLGDSVIKRNEQLAKLLVKIKSLPMSGDFIDQEIDTFGDAYEFLIEKYAIGSGKKGGEFYTPQEVSELLAKITLVGKSVVNKVYDPACGSGSLLLKFAKILGKENVRNGFYGQEINLTTYNLCRMNMFLHNIEFDKFDIACEDTLIHPQHLDDEPFECIVSNPPYSVPWDGDSNPLLINDSRFSPAGVLAPKSKADLAFTMHMLSHLATNGTAAIVEFPGVLYRGGNEQKIRKYLIDNNFVDAVIQLPDNLFFGTTIATCIIVLKKSKSTNDVLFIDASNEFIHEGNKNKLSDDNIFRVLNAYVDRKDVDHFVALVGNGTIAENDYNVSVSTYVETENKNEEINIDALNEQISQIVRRETELRTEIDKIISSLRF